MNISFSLLYFECEKQIGDLSNAIIGPELFGSEQAAIDKLFKYVESRLLNGLEDVWDLYLEQKSGRLDGTFDDDLLDYIQENAGEKLDIIEFYFDYLSDDETHAGFSIQELPTQSFFELLSEADAIEVDGTFVRYFCLTSPDEIEDQDDIILEVSYTDDDGSKFEFFFTADDIANAYWDAPSQLWMLNGSSVSTFNFAQ